VALFSSLRAKLTALFVCIFGISLITFIVLGYTTLTATQQKDFDIALFNHALDVASFVHVEQNGKISLPEVLPTDEAATEERNFPFPIGRSFFQLRDSEGHIIGASPNLHGSEIPLTESERLTALTERFHIRTFSGQLGKNVQGDHSSFRSVTYLVTRPKLGKVLLQIAAPMTYLDLNRQKLLNFLGISVPVILFLATISGFFFSNRALRPVAQMARSAERIEIGNLSERVSVATTDQEVSHLAETLNHLLDRVHSAVLANERFVADASHQLKTPLSILRGELDLMLSRERSEEEIRAFLTNASQEVNSLIRLSESLLMLARIDGGLEESEMVPVRIDELTLEVISLLGPLARNKDIALALNMSGEDTWETRGNADLLKTMLQNLIHNAIKYSHPGARIEIQLSTSAETINIAVQDNGPGIPVSKLPRLFERFYRASPQTPKERGHGLGLAIARSVAQAHHGDLAVQSVLAKGTTFRAMIKRL